MSEITKTKKELELFHLHANALISRHKGVKTKLLYALKKVVKSSLSKYEAYVEDIQEKRIMAASVDEKGNIEEDAAGKFKFTPEKFLALKKDIKKIEKEVVTVNQFIVACPVDLEQDFKNHLQDFVFEEEEILSDIVEDKKDSVDL